MDRRKCLGPGPFLGGNRLLPLHLMQHISTQGRIVILWNFPSPHFSAESFPQQVCNVPYLPRVLWGRAVVPGVDWIFFFSSPSHLPLHLVNMMRGWRGCDLVMTWFSRWHSLVSSCSCRSLSARRGGKWCCGVRVRVGTRTAEIMLQVTRASLPRIPPLADT